MAQEETSDRETLLKEVSELRSRVAELEKADRREKRLREGERRFQTLFERHHAIMLLIEPDSGRIVDANSAASQFYGYTREQLSSMHIGDINQLDPSQITEERQRAKREERNYFIFAHRLADGETRTVEVHSTPIDVQGRLLLFSIIHDITDRSRAEQELHRYQEQLETMVKERTVELETKNRLLSQEIVERRETEKALQASERQVRQFAYELETIIDSFPGLIFYKDKENRFLRVNSYLAKGFNMTKDELEGTSLFDLYPADTAQAYWDDDMEVVRSGQPKLNIEESWNTPEGTRWVLTCKIPFLDRTGSIVGVIGISQDITKRKKAERDRETLILELKDALSKIKTLSGLLPVCASCKRIRNDKGQWEQMEVYIRDRSEADFSHGICPECLARLYPDYCKKG